MQSILEKYIAVQASCLFINVGVFLASRRACRMLPKYHHLLIPFYSNNKSGCISLSLCLLSHFRNGS